MASTILVYVGLDLVGDGLMKLPFLRALRDAYPEAHITWLAGKGRTVYAGVLASLVDGLIDEVIEDAGIGLAWRELLCRPLQGRRFDLVIDTQRRVKTTLILRRIRHGAFVSGAAGYRLSDAKPVGLAKKRRMVDALLDLVDASTQLVIASPVGARQPRAGRAATGLLRYARNDELKLDFTHQSAAEQALPNKNYIGIAPGAGGIHKRWPLPNFIALANELAGQGMTPVFLLGPDEADWQSQLTKTVPAALFPLQDAGDLGKSPLYTIALAERLIVAVANDSGTGHMLAAADVPLVSLFGPTDPAKFAPYVTHGTIIRAQDFGGEDMGVIAIEAVAAAVQKSLHRPLTSQSP